jgi:Uma2 family endonuclease
MSAQPEKKLYTSADLFRINSRGDQQYELVEGGLIKIAPVSNLHGLIAANITGELRNFNKQHKLGVVLIETGYNLSYTTTRGPDVSFYTKAKAALVQDKGYKGYLDFAPDLAVEVISAGDRPDEILEKIDDYLRAGVRLIWIVYPNRELVNVIRPNQPSLILHRKNADILDGYDVLPDLTLPLATIFETEV